MRAETWTVTPAYGRDYKSAAAAQRDWESGRDFVLQTINGRPVRSVYCNVHDAAINAAYVRIRYARMTEVVELKREAGKWI